MAAGVEPLDVIALWMACAAPPASEAAPVPSPAPVASPAPIPSSAPPPHPAWTERALPFGPGRIAATRAYLRAHYGVVADRDPVIVPHVVVLHWTAGPTAESAWQTFAAETLAGRPELAGGGDLNVSAHFLVDRDGAITRLMPETWMARHVIGLNHVAVGIENVGGPDLPLTDAQVDADVALVRWLAATQPIDTLIGHHEAARLEGTRWWREDVPGYRNTKPDPGDEFTAKVRIRVADLGLAGPP